MRFADGKVTAEVDDGVGLVTLNAPDDGNAMSAAMWQGLGDALDGLERDGAVRVVVLTAVGHLAFAADAAPGTFAGPDTSAGKGDERKAYEEQASAGRERLARFGKPVIARIRGRCEGGGLWLALAAGLRIAAEDSSFAVPAARLGAPTASP
jgi:enoyl-CoA hydratase/carnithine racemase